MTTTIHQEEQLRVLVVDDSLTVRMDLSEGLEAAGFAVIACGSIADAKKQIQDSTTTTTEALLSKHFHLFILDVRLGDGDGIGLLAHIRSSSDQHLASTPVMFLSSESEVRDRVRGLKGGADEYAGKPYVLTYVVTRALELARSFAAKHDGELMDLRRPTTLVIDDSLSFREAIREALESAGYRAVTAATGEEGLQKAALLRPAVVIVDGDLPGIDGTTVIRRLRLDAALRHTPCVMITASGVSEMGAFEAGADAYLLKQTPPNEVVARVRSLLSSSPQSMHARSVRSALGANKVVVVGVGLEPVGDALRAEAYDVTFAKSADEALPLFDVDTPACLLVDAGDATECRRIRDALSNSVAIVALTRSGDDSELAIDCLTAGADEVVARGTHAPLLVARVRAQLRRKQAEEETQRERHADLARELILVENRTAQALAEERKRHLLEVEKKNDELAIANSELEAFSYSVSHDLRAPLRAINGFSQALKEDCSHLLDQDGKEHLERILSATNRMNELIDDLLTLSRVSRQELRHVNIDMTGLATSVGKDLVDARRAAKNPVTFEVQPNLETKGDPSLLRAVLENLIGNAFKFTSKRDGARIEVGAVDRPDGMRAFFVRDNGVGFDMKRAGKLFRPFQRLHTQQEFEGTGIGLATVQRIVIRHGGRAWAEASEASDGGACMYFTVPALGTTDNG